VPVEASSGSAQRRRSRPWTVRMVGLLLLVQAVAYVAFSVYLLLPYDWRATLAEGVLAQSYAQASALSFSLLLIPAAILALLSAIGFLFLFRAGWLLAMVMQAATLAACLALYFGSKPPVLYPAMLFCIVMTFYLNSFDVRVAFYGGPATGRWRQTGER